MIGQLGLHHCSPGTPNDSAAGWRADANGLAWAQRPTTAIRQGIVRRSSHVHRLRHAVPLISSPFVPARHPGCSRSSSCRCCPQPGPCSDNSLLSKRPPPTATAASTLGKQFQHCPTAEPGDPARQTDRIRCFWRGLVRRLIEPCQQKAS